MATRSNIAYFTPEGKIRSIYCHWDGYPAHNGECLRRYYTDTAKIKALVELGSISVLAPEIEAQGEHTFDSPQEGVVVAYHRDRGERLVISEYDDAVEFINDMEEYAYLWDGNEWLVNDHRETDEQGFPVFDFVGYKINDADLRLIGWED